MTQDRTYLTLLLAFLASTVVAQGIFAAWPGIDLAVSHLFANHEGRFTWAGGTLSLVNLIIRRTGELVALAITLLCLWGLLSRRMPGGELRLLGFVSLNVLIASGLIANGILKAHVGRARPADILDFGGAAPFTPAFQITDHCAKNCSFVSGEVSLAASLALPFVIILWRRIDHLRGRVLMLGLAVAYVFVVSFLRIGLGRHFLSDAVFAILLAAGTALLLYPLLGIGTARRDHAHLPTLRRTLARLKQACATALRAARP